MYWIVQGEHRSLPRACQFPVPGPGPLRVPAEGPRCGPSLPMALLPQVTFVNSSMIKCLQPPFPHGTEVPAYVEVCQSGAVMRWAGGAGGG